jgi:hypothetical protein
MSGLQDVENSNCSSFFGQVERRLGFLRFCHLHVRQLNLPASESFFNGQIKTDEGKGYFYGLGVAVGGLRGESVNAILMDEGRVGVGERVI